MGTKQRREYLLDEDGNRIRDKNGDYMFNAVHTTDWHEPETLEHWREQWAAAVNTKFEEKGLDVRIDHRSYVRQGLDLIPTVHEGANVRQMEAKGIRTEKGELNRWIKSHQPAHAGCEEEDQSPVCLDGRGKRRTFQTADTEPCRPVDRLLQPAQRRGMEQ